MSQDSKLKCNPGSLICRALSTWSALGQDQLPSFLIEAVGLVSWVLLDLRYCSLMVRVRATGRVGWAVGVEGWRGWGWVLSSRPHVFLLSRLTSGRPTNWEAEGSHGGRNHGLSGSDLVPWHGCEEVSHKAQPTLKRRAHSWGSEEQPASLHA